MHLTERGKEAARVYRNLWKIKKKTEALFIIKNELKTQGVWPLFLNFPSINRSPLNCSDASRFFLNTLFCSASPASHLHTWVWSQQVNRCAHLSGWKQSDSFSSCKAVTNRHLSHILHLIVLFPLFSGQSSRNTPSKRTSV